MNILRALFLLAGLSALGACAGPGPVTPPLVDVVVAPAQPVLVAPEPVAPELAPPLPAAIATTASVHFASGRADITASTMQLLWEIGQTEPARGGSVRISGYADSTGNPAANRRLSQRRADAVAAQLVKIGFDPKRMVVVAHGSANAGSRSAADRRVDIVVEPNSAAPPSARLAPPAASADDEADDEVADVDQTNDPLEPLNRSIFQFNQAIDAALLRPVAVAYRDNVPDFARDRVHDFLDNWEAPLRFCNDVAQGDVDRAVQTFIRFTFNTGFGIGGLFDLASAGGIPNHHTDTGATFGVWGFGEGPYLMLPLLGPSNPRDLAGMTVEFEFDPVSYRLGEIDGTRWVTDSRVALGGLDLRERNIDTLDDIERTSIDLYATIRSLYRQHREAEIRHRPSSDKSALVSSLP